MAEKRLVITEARNAVMLQLEVWPEGAPRYQGGIPLYHGKPVAVLNTAVDAELGRTVRKALATRARTRKGKEEEAG